MPYVQPSFAHRLSSCVYFLCLFIGDRSAQELMTPIANQRSEFNFDYTVFCPNLISNAGKRATAYILVLVRYGNLRLFSFDMIRRFDIFNIDISI